MDTLRYYLFVPLTTLAGVLGFALGGPLIWLGIGTFPLLLLLDLVLPRDLALRKVSNPLLVDGALYAQLKLISIATAAGFLFASSAALADESPWTVRAGAAHVRFSPKAEVSVGDVVVLDRSYGSAGLRKDSALDIVCVAGVRGWPGTSSISRGHRA